jgi:hypothetical protein
MDCFHMGLLLIQDGYARVNGLTANCHFLLKSCPPFLSWSSTPKLSSTRIVLPINPLAVNPVEKKQLIVGLAAICAVVWLVVAIHPWDRQAW